MIVHIINKCSCPWVGRWEISYLFPGLSFTTYLQNVIQVSSSIWRTEKKKTYLVEMFETLYFNLVGSGSKFPLSTKIVTKETDTLCLGFYMRNKWNPNTQEAKNMSVGCW